jgi:hypothetical protein
MLRRLAYWWYWFRAYHHVVNGCCRGREHDDLIEAESLRRFGRGAP